MTDLRDKIHQVVRGNLPATSRADMHANDVTDAIIVALPDMVAPLVWEPPTTENNSCIIARTPHGDYYIDVCGGRHQAWLESLKKPYEVQIGDVVGSMNEAEAAANAHNAAAVVAAFTGPK